MLLPWYLLPDGPTKYHAYLYSAEWQAKRDAIACRSRGWCEQCKWRRAAEVHHITYRHKYHEPLSDLIHLCRYCHRAHHQRLLRQRLWAMIPLITVIALLYIFVFKLVAAIRW